MNSNEFFEQSIGIIPSMSPLKKETIEKELSIYNLGDLLQYYPFRYEDRTKIFKVHELNDQMENIQFIGRIHYIEKI
ncbi:MAG: hypothetical protein RIR51_391, partial [Bacteroidota bacterium]